MLQNLLFYLFLFSVPLLLLLIARTRGAISTRSRLPPSPPKLPFIGNIHQLNSVPHRSLRTLSQKHGPLMLLHLGQVPTLVVSSPRMACSIMKTHDLVFASRPFSKVASIYLKGIDALSFSPYGAYWRQARKVCVTHLLSARIVQSFQKVREEEVALMLTKISQTSSSLVSVNMSEVLNSYSNDVICRVVSGKFSRQGGRNEVFREMVDENSAILGGFSVANNFPNLALLDVFFGINAKAEKLSNKWHDLLEEVIKDHGNRLKDDYEEKNPDFVDILLSIQKDSNADFCLTKEHVKGLLIDMFVAGTDTSYITLEWSLAELVLNSESMKKLQAEVRGVASGKDMIKEEDLSQMRYLKAVIKEVLRLHPPVPLLLPRESMETCILEGYEIPSKTRVIVNAWAIGRDPEFWEAPEEFRPDRFIDSSIDFKGSDFQFIPFGAGRRMCPGINFAVSTTELALANLVHRFDWELPDGIKRENFNMEDNPGLTSRRKQRLHLVAKLRTSRI